MKRIHLIDRLRGIAILLMIVYHFIFDLWFLGFLGSESTVLEEPVTIVIQRSAQFLFLSLVGTSLFLFAKKNQSNSKIQTKFYRRVAILLLSSIAMSVGSYLFAPNAWIRFGVLHFITVSTILLWPIVNKPIIQVGLISTVLIATPFLAEISQTNKLLSMIGIAPANFATLDHFALFPWLALPLLGLFIANLFEKYNLWKYLQTKNQQNFLNKIGKKSLIIYLLHQPILIGLLQLIIIFF